MKLIIIYIFLILGFSNFTNAMYVCTDSLQTIQVITDELIFFGSRDFPKLDTSPHCLINFVLEDPTRKVRGTLIISTEITFPSTESVVYVYENVSSIRFNNNEHGFAAFRGYVLFDDWGDDCPLESISRVNPFEFTDETQVIYLQSSYYPNTYNTSTLQRKHPCLWQFSAPPGYGFKYVIQTSFLSYSTLLKIENSTVVLQT